jgi:DNA polymerase I-like protein with 3'-5' exonuclease and polymerase domains
MKRLVLIDGKSVFYRGYYAMPGLSLADGTPTGGVYGFAAIAMEIVHKLNPTKVIVAWDSKTSVSKRRAIYPEYKVGRVKPGEDFYAQIPLLEALVHDLGWSFVEVEDYEADDIIGTFSRQADETLDEKGNCDYETFIISSDLDMLQIVDENTRMWCILKGFTNIEELNVAEVEQKYGIKKSQFLDLKALKGDASDNIPGVPGIGEKTAAKLLNEFDSLDGIYQNLDKIASSTKTKLENGKNSAYLSKQLAQIMFDAPVDLTKIPDFVLNPEKVAKGLQNLRFNSLIKKFNLSQEIEPVEPIKDYTSELDAALDPILRQMEKIGMLIDRNYFAQLKIEFTEKAKEIEQKIYTAAGAEFNINSPIQLSEILFGKLALPTKGIKKTTRGFSTGAKELEKLKDLHPIIKLITEYREAAKLLNTYIIPLPELADSNGRVHTTFTQDVTSTGRLSSKDPNLQNIPTRTEDGKRIRTGFIAPVGKVLVSADYSQFELRLAATLADDQNLISDFNNNLDIHTKTAAETFYRNEIKNGMPLAEAMQKVTKTQRRAAKVINFGVLYGMSVKGLSDATGMTVAESKAFIDRYFELRKPIKDYLDQILEGARENGYVETYFGRKRYVPDIKAANFMIRAAAERAATNMPIQGTEADLMKRAMIKISQKLPSNADMIMQVHDSLIIECPENSANEVAKILKQEMESVAPELKVKLKVDVTTGTNWGEL